MPSIAAVYGLLPMRWLAVVTAVLAQVPMVWTGGRMSAGSWGIGHTSTRFWC
jgi:hypothetical protein